MPSFTKIQTGFLEAQGAFQIDVGTASLPGLKFSTSPATGMFSPSVGALAFSTGSTPSALTILANGNVGIGIAIPTVDLDVVGTIKATTYDNLPTSLTVLNRSGTGVVINAPTATLQVLNRAGASISVIF